MWTTIHKESQLPRMNYRYLHCHILKCLNILQHVLVSNVITMYLKLFIVNSVEKPCQHVPNWVMNSDFPLAWVGMYM
jgi:hypothetical protein